MMIAKLPAEHNFDSQRFQRPPEGSRRPESAESSDRTERAGAELMLASPLKVYPMPGRHARAEQRSLGIVAPDQPLYASDSLPRVEARHDYGGRTRQAVQRLPPPP